MEQVHLDDRGIIEYGAALQAQKLAFDGLQAKRDCGGTLMLCEHPNVYTLSTGPWVCQKRSGLII